MVTHLLPNLVPAVDIHTLLHSRVSNCWDLVNVMLLTGTLKYWLDTCIFDRCGKSCRTKPVIRFPDADASVSSSRMRVAAATALGAAAVKAKILAEAEERELQRQVQVAVDAQIQKVQLKLNSMTQLEDALEKERSIMEVCVPCCMPAMHTFLLQYRAQCTTGVAQKTSHLCPGFARLGA